MRILGVIPSRYASTRLPGKPLVDIGGKSMVQRVVEQVFEALTCPECGSPIQIDLPGGFVSTANNLDDLGDKRRFCQAKITGYELDDHRRLVHDEHGKPVLGKRICAHH